MGQKLGSGGSAPFYGEGRAGSPSNTKSPGLRPSSIPSGILTHAAIWPQQIWAEYWVRAVPLWGRGAGSPSSRMWPGTRPTCTPIHLDPSNRLATVHERHRQDRTDNGLIAYGEAFHQRSPKNRTGHCPVYAHFYSAPQCSHCKRCTSYGNSVCLSVHPSVRPSVTRRYCVKTTARSMGAVCTVG